MAENCGFSQKAVRFGPMISEHFRRPRFTVSQGEKVAPTERLTRQARATDQLEVI